MYGLVRPNRAWKGRCGGEEGKGLGQRDGVTTPIIPISVWYYLKLRSAITSYSSAQFLLTKVQ